MTVSGTRIVARGRTDAEDRLVEADERFAALHTSCGGAMGSTLAVPELLALADKARQYRLRLSRQFAAVTANEKVSGWAEISPLSGEEAGCDIALTGLVSTSLSGPDRSDDRIVEIARHLAECSVRLDADQRIVSIATDGPDLTEFEERANRYPDRPWSDLVTFVDPETGEEISGKTCRIPGSDRLWTAILEPAAPNDSGRPGYTLYLSAEGPLAPETDTSRTPTPSLGRDLTPVLRRPVNRIIANAETIRTRLAGPLKSEYSDYAGDIAHAGQHLLTLMDDLADLEVVEAEGFQTAPDRIDVADVARRACGILGVRAAEKNISLEAPGEGGGYFAIAEFRRVLQVLLNLVGNAIRYSPADSRVRISLARAGQTIAATVADQGQGLDTQQQAKAFEKFERLGRAEDGGSGLGLYISRRIARKMGGDLTVESELGRGAQFTLTVPAAES